MKSKKPVSMWWGFVVLLVLYVVLAGVTFQFRHPWMTETELFLHFPDAMTWGTIPYDEARPR